LQRFSSSALTNGNCIIFERGKQHGDADPKVFAEKPTQNKFRQEEKDEKTKEENLCKQKDKQVYREKYEAIFREDLLSEKVYVNQLKSLQEDLGLGENEIRDIEKEVRDDVESQRQQEVLAEQKRRDDLINSGICHLGRKNFSQAIAAFTQAEQLGHPEAAQMLVKAQQKKLAEDGLCSEKGIDYTRLQNLLKAKNWKEANRETYEVMIRAVGKQVGDWFTRQDLLDFPDEDFLTINRLWMENSGGRFGFAAQKRIYVDCGAKPNGNGEYPGDTIWNKFCCRVGWVADGTHFRLRTESEGYFPVLDECSNPPPWYLSFSSGKRSRKSDHRYLFSRKRTGDYYYQHDP
jgi:hypothetical protein